MIIETNISVTEKLTRLFFCAGVLVLGIVSSIHAQPPPPRPLSIYVNPAQGLIFGAFFQGASGGSVIVYPDGSRAVTGSHGGTLSLHIGAASTGSVFVTTALPPSRSQVRIGGTLTAGSPLSNPSGNYSGTFSVTFIQQ